jgi:murein DD-endopeptidase MepM/ murein hydrolase activator NlpD
MFVALLFLPGAIAHAGALPRPQAAPAGSHAVVARPRAALSRPHAPHPRADWRWPLRGPLVGRFRVTPRAPYARGQRRGIDVAAAPGTEVRAACAGRVTFAGALPRFGRAVSVRCGALVATYLRLARVEVGRGAIVAPGQSLGTLGTAGVLRLGARRAADRRAYLDPLTLLRPPAPQLPDLGPAPRSRRPEIARRERPRPLTHHPRTAPAPPRTAPHRLPWPAYPAVALIATALPVGGLVRLRRRGRHAVRAAAAR